jgi:hypothetical protein
VVDTALLLPPQPMNQSVPSQKTLRDRGRALMEIKARTCCEKIRNKEKIEIDQWLALLRPEFNWV